MVQQRRKDLEQILVDKKYFNPNRWKNLDRVSFSCNITGNTAVLLACIACAIQIASLYIYLAVN